MKFVIAIIASASSRFHYDTLMPPQILIGFDRLLGMTGFHPTWYSFLHIGSQLESPLQGNAYEYLLSLRDNQTYAWVFASKLHLPSSKYYLSLEDHRILCGVFSGSTQTTKTFRRLKLWPNTSATEARFQTEFAGNKCCVFRYMKSGRCYYLEPSVFSG